MPRWKALPEELDPQVREFASQLRRLVDRSGLSIAAVADRTGYSKTSWERYFNGRNAPPAPRRRGPRRGDRHPQHHLTAMWELAERVHSFDAYGSDPYRTDPYGADPYRTDPYGSDPDDSDPHRTDEPRPLRPLPARNRPPVPQQRRADGRRTPSVAAAWPAGRPAAAARRSRSPSARPERSSSSSER